MAIENNLVGAQTGLIHSHHSMATFFSRTDTSTLQSEGNEQNNFVSLIVNNAGKYSAAITRKVQIERKVKENACYSLFGEQKNPSSKKSYTQNVNCILYNNLNVLMPETEGYADIDSAIEKIKAKKAAELEARAAAYKAAPYPYYNDDCLNYAGYSPSSPYYTNPERKLDLGKAEATKEYIPTVYKGGNSAEDIVMQLLTGNIAEAYNIVTGKQIGRAHV